MPTLGISPLRRSRRAVAFDAPTPHGSLEVRFSVDDAELTGDASFLLPTLLTAAMRSGQDLVVDEPVSPRMLAGARHVADIFSLWREDLRRVAIEAPARAHDPPTPERAVAAFFSAGVDSFHTVLRHRDEITHLLFIHGVFDVFVRDEHDVAVARRAADELGVPLVEVTTTARDFTDAWDVVVSYSHGVILAAVALLFEATFGTVLIPSSFSYKTMANWGTHPLIDPLWSTESLRIAHDGAEATRPMKVREVAESEVAMRHLRVCHGARRSTGAPTATEHLNCGRCEKCVRTMINLRAVGALDRCETLPDDLDLASVRSLGVRRDGDLANIVENLRMLEERQTDDELIDALRFCLAANNFDADNPLDARTLAMRLNEAEVRRDRAERRAARVQRHADKQARDLAAMQRSLSWRLTTPLRAGRARRRRDP